jgi:flagellin-like hook-associated protein FlgL
VTHTLTTFAAGSGIAAGTSSAAGDTIIGPAGANVLTINDTSGTGASGTISLNGGPPIAFTNADTDLVVTGPNGEVIHVDTTAITAGFSGDIDVTADGEMSVNGGPPVGISYSSTQAVTDPSGRTTFVDSTDVRIAGTERLEYGGTTDIFQALTALRDDLRNTRGLSETEMQDALTRRMDDIDRHHENVLNIIGDQSQTLKTIEDLTVRLDDLTLEAKQRISDVSATDVAATAVELQEAQNLLQFSYAVTAQVFQTSLLDYIA